MRDCYDSLFAAAAATTNTAYGIFLNHALLICPVLYLYFFTLESPIYVT